MRLRSLLLLVAVLLAAGCKRETKVDGDVFIVTRGGQNYKLGLVQVRFVPEKTVSAALPASVDAAKAKVSELKKKLHEAQLNESIARIGTVADVTRLTALAVGDAARVKHLPKGRELYEEVLAEHRKALDERKAALEKQQEATKATLAVAGELQGVINGAAVVDGLGEATTMVRTDADGKFSVLLPRGKYAAVATARREVGGETESYAWAVWLSATESQQRLMLSNDNLASTNCSECVLPLAEVAAVPEP